MAIVTVYDILKCCYLKMALQILDENLTKMLNNHPFTTKAFLFSFMKPRSRKPFDNKRK